MHLFPVRHHSPRASAVLRGLLDAVQPDLELVEGPSDATPLVDVLADKDTEPPVAILGFRTDGTPGSSLWPFASYSPEYVALHWAQTHRRRAAFIDIPTGTSLASHDREHTDIDGDDASEDAQAPPPPTINQRCAERTGYRSFEEFWEASFEAPAHGLDGFRQALIAYADLIRAEDRDSFHRARDAFMSREIEAQMATGVASDKVVVVLGAAHAAAIVAGDVDPTLEAMLPPPVQSSAARLEGKLSRYEAAWHRAKYFESLSADDLLTEWPATWGDAEAAPFIAAIVTPAGERAVSVASEVLEDKAAGQTAKLTAIRVLASVSTPHAMTILKQTATDTRAPGLVRYRASQAAGRETRGWRALVPFAGDAASSTAERIERLTTATDKDTRIAALAEFENNPDDAAIPAVRQLWMSDPVQDVRAKAAMTLGQLGDSESVEALISALRNRAVAPKEAKGAIAALSYLGDVRAVPDMLTAVVEKWAGPVPAEALLGMGVPALDPILTMVTSRPELAQRESLQYFVLRISWSPQTSRLLLRRLNQVLDEPEGADRATALLKLTSACGEGLCESLAQQVLPRVNAPASKAEKALVRTAQQMLATDTGKKAARA